MSAETSIHTGRISGRVLLVAVAIVTVLTTLAVILNDIVRIAYVFMGGYSIETALDSFQGMPADVAGANELNTAQYWSVLVNTDENTDTSRVLHAVAIGLTTVVFVACAITILLLCRRLWTGRTFTVSASVGVLVVSLLTIVTAWFSPWLRHTADELAFAATPFQKEPVEGTTGAWLELPHFDIGSVNSPLLVLGVILGLMALVYLGARRLQRDTDGLV